MLTGQQTEIDFTTASPGDAQTLYTLQVSYWLSRKILAYYTTIEALLYYKASWLLLHASRRLKSVYQSVYLSTVRFLVSECLLIYNTTIQVKDYSAISPPVHDDQPIGSEKPWAQSRSRCLVPKTRRGTKKTNNMSRRMAQYFSVPLSVIIPAMLHSHISFICHWNNIILAPDIIFQ